MEGVKNRYAISGVGREGIRKVPCDGIGFVGVQDELEKSHGDYILAIIDVFYPIEKVADRDLSEWLITLMAIMATVKNTMKRKYSVEYEGSFPTVGGFHFWLAYMKSQMMSST
jgi:hypothetical protein